MIKETNMQTEIRLSHILGAMLIVSLIFTSGAWAMDGHDTHSDSMDHQSMTGAFKHEMTTDGIKAEFQVMSLESMNMQDPDGATHHVMVKFFDADTGTQIKQAVGKIKIIGPSNKESVMSLKDYNGIYAANFTVDEPGKYGVICLAKVDDKKPLYKFWYTH
jgi:hypothetical protein